MSNNTFRIHDVAWGTWNKPRVLAFPGGEPHCFVDVPPRTGPILVDARIGDALGFLQLLTVLDAVKARRPAALGLFLPYFPGARQDRRQFGAPLTVKIYADAIRASGVDAVLVLDPHSDVLAAMLDIDVLRVEGLIPRNVKYDGLVCPDAGAEKRTHAIAKDMQLPVFYGRKHRDQSTGELSGFSCDALPDGRHLLVDDICDGGGTFLGLADCVRRPGVTLDLWVSHGIFSKGLDDLLERFDRVITTDSFPSAVGTHERLDRVILAPHAERFFRERLLPC